MFGFTNLFSTSPEKAEKRARKKAEKRAKIEAKKAAKRRSTLKALDGRKYRAHLSEELEPEEIREIYRLSEHNRAEVEMPGIQKRSELAYPNFAPPKRRRNRSRRRRPTNRTKRNTSLESLRGEEGKFHDYPRNREDYSDMRPRDEYGNLIIPPSPPPTVRMRIHAFEEASQGTGNHMGGKTRKRRRKRRRKTKRKGRRKTKKRRKRRKRKTRRKR